MAKKDLQKMGDMIIPVVGGKDNISSITNCMTRLRFSVKDKSLVDLEKASNVEGIVGATWAGDQFQIIIGTNVGEVCDYLSKKVGISVQVEEEKTEGSFLNKFAATITKIVVPALGVLCACGIISGLNSVLTATGAITTESGTYILLNAMGNACLTFFPVILGYTSAKAFGMDPFIGMILGATLIFPSITESMNAGEPIKTLFEGSFLAMPVYKTFLGLPIIFPSTGYESTLIPIMLINLVASKIEKWLKNILPNVTKQFCVPFITILTAGIIGVIIIGPLSMVIQNCLSAVLSGLMKISPVLAFVVITLIYQPLVIFGLHWPLITLGIVEFITNGNSLIVASIFPASFTHMAACLAVFLASKDIKIKNVALPAFLSACFCIIEPSIYGITLPVKKRFAFCMLGGLVGGLILVLTSSPMYAISMGVTGFMSYVNPATKAFGGVIWAIVACLVGFAVTFALTWITYKPEEDKLGK